MDEHIVYSLPEIDGIATLVADTLRGGEVLTLSGDLGTGKTTFTQALARVLGVAQSVSSPTFALEKQYLTTRGFTLHHFDWYRLTASQVEDLGVVELFGDPASVTVIEWPERAPHLLPKTTQWLIFEDVNATTRRITFHT